MSFPAPFLADYRHGTHSNRESLWIPHDVCTYNRPQQWTRLIRFIAAETSQVHIGQPVDPTLDGKSFVFLSRLRS